MYLRISKLEVCSKSGNSACSNATLRRRVRLHRMLAQYGETWHSPVLVPSITSLLHRRLTQLRLPWQHDDHHHTHRQRSIRQRAQQRRRPHHRHHQAPQHHVTHSGSAHLPPAGATEFRTFLYPILHARTPDFAPAITSKNKIKKGQLSCARLGRIVSLFPPTPPKCPCLPTITAAFHSNTNQNHQSSTSTHKIL